jgi:FixJ family two-component response regulator
VTAADAIVFVVDDNAAVREALSSLVRSVGLRVETFASAHEFLQYRRPDAVACLVLDVRLPGPSGLDLQRELANSGAPVPIVFITGHGDIPMTVRAIKAGAVEFLLKPVREQDLLGAIRQAHDRDRSQRRDRAEVERIRHGYETLTPREREVAALLLDGLLNKQIAERLLVAEITVKVHRRRVLQKMGVRSVTKLARLLDKLIPAG